MDITTLTMDLITYRSLFELIAYTPLLVLVMSTFFAFSENPVIQSLVNTTLVVLKATEVVWRPALKFALDLLKPLAKALIRYWPHMKSSVMYAMNTTLTALRTVQGMGISLSNAFPAVLEALKDISKSLIILTRALAHFVYYLVRGATLIVSSVESVFGFGKRLLFEAHLITMRDLSNAMLPLVIVTSLLCMMYWLRKGPPEKSVKEYQPRRSSRLARKRAMLCMSDMSDPFPSCKKPSTTSSYL
jgi:hypothetical protein